MRERIFAHWKTSVAGLASFATGLTGIITTIYYPANNSPKALLLVAAIAGFITNLLAKDN